MSSVATQVIGYTGATLVLLGFIRVNSGKWDNKSIWYELDNLVGTLMLAIYHFALGAHASLVLNLVWAIAAVNGINSINHRRRLRNKKKGK